MHYSTPSESFCISLSKHFTAKSALHGFLLFNLMLFHLNMDSGPYKKSVMEITFYKQPKTSIDILVDENDIVEGIPFHNRFFANVLQPGDKLLKISGQDGRSYSMNYIRQKQPNWIYFTFGWKTITFSRTFYPKQEDPICFMRKRYWYK